MDNEYPLPLFDQTEDYCAKSSYKYPVRHEPVNEVEQLISVHFSFTDSSSDLHFSGQPSYLTAGDLSLILFHVHFHLVISQQGSSIPLLCLLYK